MARFRDALWQRIVRLGLVSVMGLVIAGGTVMARAADTKLAGRSRHDLR